MDKKILLIVDVQTCMVEDTAYNIRKVIDNIKNLITAARANNVEVVYVRHNDGKGSSLEAGSDGWQIYHEIAPTHQDKIFDKTFNSSFKNTGLKEYLDSKNVKTIILTGMQTEYCIDTTCKCAFDYGYKLIIPEGTNTTFDNQFLTGEKLYQFYNNVIWNKRFADVVSMEAALDYMKQ